MYDKLTENDIKKMQEEIDYRKLVVRPKELEAVKKRKTICKAERKNCQVSLNMVNFYLYWKRIDTKY